MMLTLRNKQMVALLALIILSLIVLSFILLGVTHINVWQTFDVNPDVISPWF